MNVIKQFIEQRFHRNGVSGDPAVVTTFKVAGDRLTFIGTTRTLIAVSLLPHLNSDLTPFDSLGGEKAPQDAFIDRWVDVVAVRTVVVDPGDPTAPMRGADLWGRQIAQEWRRLCLTGTAHGASLPGYDPALEWYGEVHADPDETARLVAENNASVAEIFGLPKGTLA